MPISENIYYCYVYLDPRKPGRFTYENFITFLYEPFYVGKGKAKRYLHHLNFKYENKRNSHKSEKIKNILLESYKLEEYIIKVIDRLNNECSFCFEKYLISSIGRNDLNYGPLCNHSNGGEGGIDRDSIVMRRKNGWFKSEESRKSFSEKISLNNSITSIGNKNWLGKKHKEESKLKISNKNKIAFKNGQTLEHRKKNSDAVKEKWKDPEYRLKISESKSRRKQSACP